MKNAKVTIFHTPTCPYCHMAIDYFDTNNIDYESVDLVKNPERAQEMMQKSGQTGVPVIIIKKDDDGKEEVIIGFDQEKIDNSLGIKEK